MWTYQDQSIIRIVSCFPLETCLTKPEDSCLAGPIRNMEEVNNIVGSSVLQVTRKEDLRKSERDDICAPINIQMDEISETGENNFPSLPGACPYLFTLFSQKTVLGSPLKLLWSLVYNRSISIVLETW